MINGGEFLKWLKIFKVNTGEGGNGNVVADGFGTTGQIPKYTSSGLNIGSSSITDSGDLVTINNPLGGAYSPTRSIAADITSATQELGDANGIVELNNTGALTFTLLSSSGGIAPLGMTTTLVTTTTATNNIAVAGGDILVGPSTFDDIGTVAVIRNLSSGVWSCQLSFEIGEGNVVGPESAYDGAVALFDGTSGTLLKTVDFTPVDNSLFGYSNVGMPANITIGTGLSLSGNTLSAVGSGSGDVSGPELASAVGALAVFGNTNGKTIAEPTFTPANDSLLGYLLDTTVVSNITLGTGLTIVDGALTVTAFGTGDVIGPGISTAGGLCIYSDTTGKHIAEPAVVNTANTLVGYSGAGALTNISAGTNITITGGSISATGEGFGTVTGPESSTANTLVFWNNTAGTLVGNSPFSPANNSLLGYSNTGLPVNVTAGSNISISGNVISATGGTGDVIGPGSSSNGGLALFSGSTGKILQGTVFTPANNSLVGYDGSGLLTNVIAGSNITIADNVISATGATMTIIGTPNQIIVIGSALEPQIALSANPVLPGTSQVTFPKGTTLQRSPSPSIGDTRVNTTTNALESYLQDGWTNLGGGSVTEVIAGTGLNVGAGPGGVIIKTGTLNLANTAVIPGTHQFVNATVDQQGRLTAISSLGIDTGTVSYNLILGSSAGNSGITGGYNTIVGQGAGAEIVTGISNSFFGYNTGNSVSNGQGNSAFGSNCLSQTNSSYCTAFGNLSSYNLQNGNENASFGASSLGANAEGSNNAAFGFQALWTIEGSGNTAVGSNAAYGTIAGSNQTYIGYLATASVVSGLTNCGAFGYNAVVSASNTYAYGNSIANHGFGRDTADTKVDIAGNLRYNGITYIAWDPAGTQYDQTFSRIDGAEPATLISLGLPVTGVASTGSTMYVKAKIIVISGTGTGGAYAESTVAVIYNGTNTQVIGTALPTITFQTQGTLGLVVATWSIVNNAIVLTGIGVNAQFTNWITTYEFFSNAAGLT